MTPTRLFFFLFIYQRQGQTGPPRLAFENIQLLLSRTVLTPSGLGLFTSKAQTDWTERKLLFIKCSQLFKLAFPKSFSLKDLPQSTDNFSLFLFISFTFCCVHLQKKRPILFPINGIQHCGYHLKSCPQQIFCQLRHNSF